MLGAEGWQDLFGPGGLAEVTIAAVLGGQVLAGTIDRLLMTPDRIRIVDYKTARRVPGVWARATASDSWLLGVATT